MLGSGLGDFADTLLDAVATPYGDLPHWPASKVVGHAGRLVIGERRRQAGGGAVGRAHFYEGHDLSTVVFATRVMGRLGVKQIILTNAAGGINTGFAQGALMVIDDHINLLGQQPARRPQRRALRAAFPGHERGVFARGCATSPTPPRRRKACRCRTASTSRVHGPSYETPAEIRFFRTIGADAVGMSTVPEAIAARHMGMEVLGISCITNMAAGVLPQPLVHDEVMETARRVRGSFIALLEGIIERL